MAEMMPSDADIAAYINAIYGSPTAGTMPGRLNFLQDWSGAINFNPFGQPFFPEMFPEEQFAPVTRQIYATDPGSPYLSIFDAIDQGVDPTSAARAAIEQGAFGDARQVRDDRLDEDVLRTAREYAGELRTFERERAKWEREQAKAAAEAPVTLNELLFPQSEYDIRSQALGRPEGYTVDDMLDAYNRSRFERAQEAQFRRTGSRPERAETRAPKQGGGWRGVVGDVWGAIDSAARTAMRPWEQATRAAGEADQGKRTPTRGKLVASGGFPQQRKVSEFRVGPEGSVADLIYRDAARRAMEQQQQTPVWSPKAEQAKRNIALLSLIGGQ